MTASHTDRATDSITPSDWIAQEGASGFAAWGALPFWRSIADLNSTLAAVAEETDTLGGRIEPFRQAFFGSFVRFVGFIAQQAASKLVPRVDVFECQTGDEGLWSQFVQFADVEPDAELVEMSVRVRRLSGVYGRSFKALVERFKLELSVNSEFSARYADVSNVRLLGDMHWRGAVALIECASGERIVYKPRSMGTDALFSSLLETLGRRSKGLVPLHPRTLDRGDYGWQDFVEYRSPAAGGERESWFERMGSLVAIAHAFTLTDLHFENIKCAGSSPMVIDSECLFHYGPLHDIRSDGFEAAGAIRSVLWTGLLPNWTKRYVDVEAVDMSALGSYAAPGRTGRQRQIVIDDHGLTSYRHVEVDPAQSPECLPESLDGLSPVSGYEEAILRGFDLAAAALSDQETKSALIAVLHAHQNVRVRVIAAPTFDYLMRLQSPDAIGQPDSSANPESTVAWLKEREAQALDAGCIPVFERIFSTAQIFSDFDHISGVAVPLDLVCRALESLSPGSFHNQRMLVARSLTSVSVDPGRSQGLKPIAHDINSYRPLELLEDLQASLERNACWEAGRVWWPTGQKLDPGRWRLDVTNLGIYDGLAGVVFALGIARSKSPRIASFRERSIASLRAAVERSIETARSEGAGVQSLDLTNGPLGALLVLGCLAELDGDDETRRWVAGSARAFSLPANAGRWDYIDGSSGTALGMGRLYELTGDAAYLENESTALDSLASSISAALELGELQAGFAHGLSGAAAAFAFGARHADHRVRLSAAQTCLDAEKLMVDVYRRDPSISRDAARVLASSWCWGSTGQVQAQLIAGSDPSIAVPVPDRDSLEAASLNLCHGLLGAALVQSGTEYVAHFGTAAMRSSDQAIDSVLRSGRQPIPGPPHIYQPGLFTGISGLMLYLAAKRDAAEFELPTFTYRPTVVGGL